MHRRREVDSEAASRLLKSSQGAGHPIEGLIFPLLHWREPLVGVNFVDCDVGRLKFAAPPFRSIRLSDVAFIDCSGPYGVRYERIRFSRCSWQGGRLSGSIRRSVLEGCRFQATEIDDLILASLTIQDFIATQATGQGLTIRDSALRRARFAGRLDHVSLVDLKVEAFDLADLHVTDGGLLGIVGDLRAPEFDDSFVVAAEAVAALKPTLRELVRPEAKATVDRLVDDGVALEWFDERRLDAVPGDGPRLFPEEQRAVLRALWEHRMRPRM
jgi:hypothetical protein